MKEEEKRGKQLTSTPLVYAIETSCLAFLRQAN
jgi:hypothetical protein